MILQRLGFKNQRRKTAEHYYAEDEHFWELCSTAHAETWSEERALLAGHAVFEPEGWARVGAGTDAAACLDEGYRRYHALAEKTQEAPVRVEAHPEVVNRMVSIGAGGLVVVAAEAVPAPALVTAFRPRLVGQGDTHARAADRYANRQQTRVRAAVRRHHRRASLL